MYFFDLRLDDIGVVDNLLSLKTLIEGFLRMAFVRNSLLLIKIVVERFGYTFFDSSLDFDSLLHDPLLVIGWILWYIYRLRVVNTLAEYL
jgi:hypothetical protein